MKRYSKLFGVGVGIALGQLLAVLIPPDQAEGLGRALELVLPIIGTYVAPPNSNQ